MNYRYSLLRTETLIQLPAHLIDDIKNRTVNWESENSAFLEQNNEIADMWRIRKPNASGDDTQLTNTRTAELVRGSESIATLMFRMMTASDPSFDVVPKQIGQDANRLNSISTLIQWQQMHLNYRKNLLRALSSMVTFGTTICEERWVTLPNAKNPITSKILPQMVFA